MDRGYIDYEWFVQLTRQGVYFVTRLKDTASFEVVENRSVPPGTNVRKDQIIFFHSQAIADREHFFRIVEVWDDEKQRSFIFLTNQLTFAATTIAAIYKDRWQVELFFKAMKQNLKIKTFLGTSANAGQDADLDGADRHAGLAVPAADVHLRWSLSNLVALLRQQLFVYRDLWIWLNTPFEGPPAAC